MRRLSHKDGQQHYLLQRVQALGSQEMQWALIIGVHVARELHPPLMADHRGKSVGPDKLEVVASVCYLGDMP